jgi:hypothetical protein
VGVRGHEDGQATVEYAAVALVVALVLATAGAVAAARGGAVGDALGRQIARALCIVTGGDCDRELEPCVTRATSHALSNGLTVLVARLESDRVVVQEHRSDGSVVVTYAETDGAGLDLDGGTGLRVTIGGRSLRVGGELAASVLVRQGDGAAWELPDARAAASLVERLRRGRWAGDAATARSRFGERGVTAGAQAGLAVRNIAGALGLSAGDVWGSRVEPSTGRRTFYVRRANELVATGTVRGTGASAAGAAEEEYAVTVDAAGRAVDLAVLRTGRLRGSADLPAAVQPAAGLLSAPTRGERIWVTETHLDLSDPDNAAAAGAFVAQVRDPRPHLGAAVDVSRRLAERLDEAGVINARTYALQATTSGLDARGSVRGLKGAVRHQAIEERSRLVSAATRGRDGSWVTREDCERAAASHAPSRRT